MLTTPPNPWKEGEGGGDCALDWARLLLTHIAGFTSQTAPCKPQTKWPIGWRHSAQVANKLTKLLHVRFVSSSVSRAWTDWRMMKQVKHRCKVTSWSMYRLPSSIYTVNWSYAKSVYNWFRAKFAQPLLNYQGRNCSKWPIVQNF